MNLPKNIGGWTMSEGPRKITAQGIFDYMDGAGELYLGYHFQHLDVYEYSMPDEENILVELYWMESSDEAFGLLSGDWGGDATDLGQPSGVGDTGAVWPGTRALYGRGLLRIWSDQLYVRILAFRETERSKAAVMELGRVVVKGRANPAPPKLISAMPLAGEAGFRLRADRLCYFRSHLVLNSIYFLSTSNILDLGRSAEVVTATYRSPDAEKKVSPRLLLVRYRDKSSARAAIAHFEKVYLPEKKHTAVETSSKSLHVCEIEDGWLGYACEGRFAALVFECPRQESAVRFLEDAFHKLDKIEASHE